MGALGHAINSIRAVTFRTVAMQAVNFGIVATTALIIWKALICATGSESPIVVVLTGSMEPGFQRGDILFLHMNKAPIRAGEIVVFHIDGQEIPIVHRVIKVHERQDTKAIDILTKGEAQHEINWRDQTYFFDPVPMEICILHGDSNEADDYEGGIYASHQQWLQEQDVSGRVVGFLPYVGWVTIIMTEKPIIKYILIGALGLLVMTSKD